MYRSAQLIFILIVSSAVLSGTVFGETPKKEFEILSQNSQTISKPLFNPGLNSANADQFKVNDGSNISTLDPKPIHPESYSYSMAALDPELQKITDNAK